MVNETIFMVFMATCEGVCESENDSDDAERSAGWPRVAGSHSRCSQLPQIPEIHRFNAQFSAVGPLPS